MTKTAIATIEPPKEMTREDRRIIFAQLNEIYIGEDKGYSAGWTDQRVATHLGVPRAWVASIRDENFGPLRENETSTALRGELDKLREWHDSIVRTSLEIENDFAKRLAAMRVDGERIKGQIQALAGKIDRAL